MTHDYHTLLHAWHPRLAFQGSDGFNCNHAVPRSCSTAQRVERAAKLSFSSCSSLDKPETNSQPSAWSPYNRDTAWGHKKGTSIFKFGGIKASKMNISNECLTKRITMLIPHRSFTHLYFRKQARAKENEEAWCVWWVVRPKLYTYIIGLYINYISYVCKTLHFIYHIIIYEKHTLYKCSEKLMVPGSA